MTDFLFPASELHTWEGCDEELLHYKVLNGGHTWPGGYQYLPELLIGKTNQDLDATETIWNFFNGYPK